VKCELCQRRKATTEIDLTLGGKVYHLKVCQPCVDLQAPTVDDDDLWEQERRAEQQQIAAMHGDYGYY
jgi:protein-arginine kinase activator protein McsA